MFVNKCNKELSPHSYNLVKIVRKKIKNFYKMSKSKKKFKRFYFEYAKD